MKKYRYNIINLDCANCARIIEESLNKNPKLHNVVVNFNTSKISYETDSITLEEINKLVDKIEPGCMVVDKENVEKKREYHVSILIAGVILGLLGSYNKVPDMLRLILTLISYIMLLYRPFINAIKTFIKNKTINENALITISCIGAYLIGQVMEGMMVVALYTLGKILEEKAINNTRTSIKELVNIKQDYANLKTKDGISKVDLEEVKVGDTLIIKKGEKIPLDGIVLKGKTILDMSMLTGESELVNVAKNDAVLSGSINSGDVIEIKVTNNFKDSTVFKILELLEEATDKKARTETLVSKLSKIYTPIVLALAIMVILLLPLFTDISFNESLYRGLTFLVISCPCAIAISVPLSYFTGIGISSKNGILVKGSNYLDNIAHITDIVFDKTGTLTTGTFTVTDIILSTDKYTKEEIVDIITKGEALSNHPLAKSIVKLTNKKINSKNVKNYKEISGKGIEYELDGHQIKIGTISLCNGCKINEDIHVNIDKEHVATIIVDDGIKADSKSVISALHNLGIKTHMFTGDKKDIALAIGQTLGIDDIQYEMLPTDKYSTYEKLKSEDKLVAYVGDGINDAPVLKRSDIGISMGSIGSESALEASDIVIMNDDLKKIIKAIDISKYTNYIIKQNLILAISVKVIILILSIFGLATMWAAVFADTGLTLITIINTLRIMKKFN